VAPLNEVEFNLVEMTLRRFSSAKKFFGATVRIYSQGDSNVTSGAAAALL
jgi:hypothetical protein